MIRNGALAAIALAFTAGASFYVIRAWMAPKPHAFAVSAESPPTREALADWCPAGYGAIASGCLAVPAPSPHASLLIYLHGRYAKDQSTEETERQRRVAVRFTSKGYAVLALRGRLGGCGTEELSDWYCWPSNDRTIDGAGDVVAAWQEALGEAEKRVHPEHRLVLGFSNGGYFASLLASRGLLEADAFVIAHGGPVEPVGAAKGTPPLLLISADDDIAQEDMLRLDVELTKVRWPHDHYARAGGHGLTDQDIDTALAFFARAEERLPLNPPIAGLHRASHHSHDAGAPAPEASSEEESLGEESTPGAEPPEDQ